ncbi:uncharacterized protein K460DRAFT_370495 [Cucurbitaria berberidis CBS 394.84]|uniref:Uncharacterized protein n=1 Tax=Cucurbitaria berberidis CBS 394.84 TaxID=1168544 RepID=A0A9P4GC73_9PLEO|nr:uncharacterized protein K460DRAFT_370495 [Cucurbitaria berberidis CBS 394.84]KAF1842530.1 hypothetical protein K460DRAFT_370495 [Cucurbitaria berberidis CBS 394.84]
MRKPSLPSHQHAPHLIELRSSRLESETAACRVTTMTRKCVRLPMPRQLGALYHLLPVGLACSTNNLSCNLAQNARSQVPCSTTPEVCRAQEPP